MLLLGLNEESVKLLFVQFITEYTVYYYSKGIGWLGGVMCILWNRSFSAVVKISRWLRLFFVKNDASLFGRKMLYFQALFVFNVIDMLFW